MDWEDVRAGMERWEERRMMSSRRSGGRVACVWDCGFDCWICDCRAGLVVEVVEVDVDEKDERSTFRSADLRSWDLTLRKREAFNAYLMTSILAMYPYM